MNWAEWSRETVSMMGARTRDMFVRHGLALGNEYSWDIDTASLIVDKVPFGLLAVGTVTGDAFTWAWANDELPAIAKHGMERVRQFGEEHDLPMLTEPILSGGVAQAKECVAVAGRVLNASGIFIDRTETGHIAFVLYERQ